MLEKANTAIVFGNRVAHVGSEVFVAAVVLRVMVMMMVVP